MKHLLLILLLIVTFNAKAQTNNVSTFNNPEIKNIVISGSKMFNIKVIATKRKTILVKSKTEGELSKFSQVVIKNNTNSLSISTVQQPFLIPENDKLSAHKVFSVDIELYLPEHLNLDIKSEIATVEISGVFKDVLLELEQGNANLFHFKSNARIFTTTGHINLNTNFANVISNSKLGVVKTEELTSGLHTIKINTISGNINVTKTKK
ncbi:hypothetical protein [Lacinutrix sp. MedPE-SW]|uniref:hypothetical protein n=1 Tax=Lacinutrix sp. MedPE-SW TaxID=1860087 RepID=UPI000919E599|nr:hypothetical protein [Lacinutrix sp. MedPE-SW]OIQ23336.1 MAG: hypothetical protein BM549_04800 [Lacinutrix sp. MedPE-SW]